MNTNTKHRSKYLEVKDLETKVNLTINLSNASEFIKLISDFSKKAHELSLIAHELEVFEFEGKVEQSILSDNSDKCE